MTQSEVLFQQGSIHFGANRADLNILMTQLKICRKPRYALVLRVKKITKLATNSVNTQKRVVDNNCYSRDQSNFCAQNSFHELLQHLGLNLWFPSSTTKPLR